MTNSNVNLYTRAAEKQKKRKKSLNSKSFFYESAEYLIAFFLNKTCLFGAISPFGISYFAATFPMQEMSFGTIAAFLGIIFIGPGIFSLKYVGTLALYLLFMMLYNKDVSEKKWVSALAASLSLFIVGMVFVISDGFLLYDTMLLMLEAIFSFLSFFAFDKASVLIRTIKTRKVLEPTEVLSMVFLFSVIIFSISSIPNLEAAGHVMAVSAILILAVSSGFLLSTACGVIFGAAISMSSVLPAQVICTYTISALSAGLFRRYGKLASCFAFIFSNALVTIYVNSSSLTIIDIFCTLSAVLVVLLIPKSFFIRLSKITSNPIYSMSNTKETRILEMVTQRLGDVSSAFTELSGIFSRMTETNTKTNELSAGAIFDSVYDDVCAGCNLCTFCWHKNRDTTLVHLSSLFSSMSERGYAIEFDAPCDFRSECVKFDDFLESTNRHYEIQKINISWASRVCESKLLVSQQFDNMSYVLNGIVRKLAEGFECDEILERRIGAELDKKGIAASDIKVMLTDCYEITMHVKSCGRNHACSNLIAATVGSCIGTPVFSMTRRCSEQECFLRFREKTNYALEVGFAKTSPDGNTQSGDSHAFLPVEDGKYVLCLSDGMGHGKEASIQSRTTTELLKRLLLLGFDKEIALKLINTFLLFKSQNETYATADVCVVNLYSGAIEFIKSGAVSSFLKSKGNLSEIKCNSLPAGAVSKLNADCELLYASDGDLIVMTTDGITDALDANEKATLTDIIENFEGNSPQELADEIIKAALKACSDKIYDDMTVLVAKISEEM